MKAKVIKEFIDRHTRKFHGIGEEIILTDERFAEIEKAGRYVEKIGKDETVRQHPAVSEALADVWESEQPGQVTAAEQPGQEKPKKTRRNRKKKSED